MTVLTNLACLIVSKKRCETRRVQERGILVKQTKGGVKKAQGAADGTNLAQWDIVETTLNNLDKISAAEFAQIPVVANDVSHYLLLPDHFLFPPSVCSISAVVPSTCKDTGFPMPLLS